MRPAYTAWRVLVLGYVALSIQAAGARALMLDRPCCAVMTHVSGEFTDHTTLATDAYESKEIVQVTPFHACEPLQQQPQELAGRLALVQRGECNFVRKVWHAQQAGAIGVVVMDSAARPEAPHHIIMQKDENASLLEIPGVFVSYRDGEHLLLVMRKALPWSPVLVTLSDVGEMPQDRTQYRMLKRAVAYVFLVSAVCALSSGLSIASSFVFSFMGKLWRTRVTRKLPVMKYRPQLQQELLHHAIRDAHVLDRILLDGFEDDEDVNPSVNSGVELDFGSNGGLAAADAADAEACSICLDDFAMGETIKVLPCQHLFHVECIDPWLEGRSGCCPLCKQDAISASDDSPKSIFGFTLPRLEQILRQEHWFHTFFLMLPASLVSCIIVNSAAAVIRGMWP